MNLAGVFAPIPTPFDDRDRVDTTRLKAALARWIKKPLTGFARGHPARQRLHRRHRPRVDAGRDQSLEARG
jgi:hypothetical protein